MRRRPRATVCYSPITLPAECATIIQKHLLAVSLFACALGATGHTQNGAVLQSAAVNVALTSPTSCEVTMALETTTSDDVDHRLEAFAGTGIELMAVRDAAQAGSQRQIGITRSLVVRPLAGKAYQIQYRVIQPEERAFRCPIWVPAVATDGRSRPVTITVALPERSSPKGSSFPALSWDGSGGTATLAHVPAFVRVSYSGESTGQAAGPPDIARAMDAVAVAVFCVATACWVWRRRRA
jgi:hypothetical protein